MEEEMEKVIKEIDDYGGTVQAIEDGYLQSRIAHRALERKLDTDKGDRVVVGENYFRHAEGATDFGEVFRMDPDVSRKVIERFQRVKETRDQAAVDRTLAALRAAAVKEGENLMPYLVDCCHAYATVGEMVSTLKKEWGEFQEPVRL
jgi:methylmalonyl-CoA mutase N-terminal domain/subunit